MTASAWGMMTRWSSGGFRSSVRSIGVEFGPAPRVTVAKQLHYSRFVGHGPGLLFGDTEQR